MFQYSITALLTLLLGMSLNTTAYAVDDNGGTPERPPNNAPSLDELMQKIDAAMPRDITEDNAELLRRLMQPMVSDKGPSDVFDPVPVEQNFRMRRVVPSKGCFAPQPSCILSDGSRGGGGAYKEIRYDTLGNLGYLSRLADPSGGNPESVTAYQLPTYTGDHRATVDSFFDVFTKLFGVPAMEMPARDTWVVEELAVGYARNNGPSPATEGTNEVIIVSGVVRVPRVLQVAGLSSPVPVLGSRVWGAVDDIGIHHIRVEGWTRFATPDLTAARTLSRQQLVASIADELSKSLAEMPDSIAMEIAYAKPAEFAEIAYGGPDSDEGSPSSPSANGSSDEHLFVPVLVTTVTPFYPSDDPTEEEQAAAFSTAGEEIITSLVELGD
jgi:hypothetical protein